MKWVGDDDDDDDAFVVLAVAVVVAVVAVVVAVVAVVVVVVVRRVLGRGSSRSAKLKKERTKTHLLAGRWVHHLHSPISSSLVVVVVSCRRGTSPLLSLLGW